MLISYTNYYLCTNKRFLILNYILKSVTELVVLLGPFAVLALLMNVVTAKLQKWGCELMGRDLFIYGFCWLGTIVHESSHAFFALIFGHKIKKIVFFHPKAAVTHSYNKRNIYHQIGNLFIGIGPIIFGSLALFVSAHLLFGINLSHYSSAFTEKISGISSASWWRVALFLYITFSVGSSITLSKSDIKAALWGTLFFSILFIGVRVATLVIFSSDAEDTKWAIISGLSALYIITAITLVINLIFALIIKGTLIVLSKLPYTPYR